MTYSVTRFLRIIILTQILLLCMAYAAFLVPESSIRPQFTHGFPASMIPMDWEHDNFGECLVLGATLSPSHGIMNDLFDPQRMTAPDHCAGLIALANHPALAQPSSYTRYWLGTVYLARLLLSVMNFDSMRRFCLLASFLSAFSLVVGVWRFNRSGALLLAVFFGLFAVFGHMYALQMNIVHAAELFMPLFALAGGVLLSSNPRRDMNGIAVMVGVVTYYFNLLTGGIPFVAVVLVLTTLFLTPREKSEPFAIMLWHYGGVLGAYGLGMLASFVIKLMVLSLFVGHPEAWSDFYHNLFYRMGHGESTEVLRSPIPHSLWFLMTSFIPHFARPVFMNKEMFGVVLWGSFVAWIIGFGIAVHRAKYNGWLVCRIAAPWILAWAIFPAWYLLFSNHSFVHGHFMPRFLCVPMAIGYLFALDRLLER